MIQIYTEHQKMLISKKFYKNSDYFTRFCFQKLVWYRFGGIGICSDVIIFKAVEIYNFNNDRIMTTLWQKVKIIFFFVANIIAVNKYTYVELMMELVLGNPRLSQIITK